MLIEEEFRRMVGLPITGDRRDLKEGMDSCKKSDLNCNVRKGRDVLLLVLWIGS
jgi:hypothetical protein